MAKIQCPNCFEQIDLVLDARRNYQSRRCPQGQSSRVKVGSGLQHCYCKITLLVPSNVGAKTCCRCGDILKVKTA